MHSSLQPISCAMAGGLNAAPINDMPDPASPAGAIFFSTHPENSRMKKLEVLSLAAVSLLACGAVLAQQKMDAMKGMDMSMKSGSAVKAATHRASGVVKQVDPKAGTVTLAHEAIRSLNWPAMTMGFKVKDKTLFDKLGVGAKVDVQLEQEGKDYVVTRVE